MISTSGLTSWMRFPAAVYMAAMSVTDPVPQAGVRMRPPTRDRLGSFMMSIPATSGFDRYRAAMPARPRRTSQSANGR